MNKTLDVLINEKLNVSLGFLAFVLLLCHNRRILYYTLLLLEAIYAGICGIFDPSRWVHAPSEDGSWQTDTLDVSA